MGYTWYMKLNAAERLFMGALLVIAFGIVLHTPVTVWLSTMYPDSALLIKSWKEILMGVALLLFVLEVGKRKLFGEFFGDKIIQSLLVYAGIHFILMVIIPNNIQAVGAGLLIDLRYLLFFTLVYGAAKLLPNFRIIFLKTIFAGAAVVLGFALLQMFVLPRDILATLGYDSHTIEPYLTVDDNEEYIRINSTLRGPNPLGAYAVVIFALVIAAATKFGRRLKNDQHLIVGIAVAIATLMLAVSYSRSALIGLIIALIIMISVLIKPELRKRAVVIFSAVVLSIAAVLLVARTNPVISNIFWHDDPNGGAKIDSNKGHADSLASGTLRMARQPIGGGIGSTGSASLLTKKPFIIENQYLYIAHEVGWIGLGLFVWLFVEIMRRLWQRRRGALSLGVFASGCALAVIGLLLPVWVDDTVSIIWWGLAGLVIGGAYNARSNN